MTGYEEHLQLRENLNTRINYLRNKYIHDARIRELCTVMLNAVHYAGDLRTLRIYHDHMMEQENIDQLRDFLSVSYYISKAYVGGASVDYTEEHLNRYTLINEALEKERDALFPSAPKHSFREVYLSAIRGAAVLGDEAVFDYLRSNLVSVSVLTMSRDIMDAKTLLPLINEKVNVPVGATP